MGNYLAIDGHLATPRTSTTPASIAIFFPTFHNMEPAVSWFRWTVDYLAWYAVLQHAGAHHRRPANPAGHG
jgi:hypothetical protein